MFVWCPAGARKGPVEGVNAGGHMSWSHAIGEDACAMAVEYCAEHVSAGGERAAVLNPFCGQGSVLAVANGYGLDAVGMDVSLKCCRIAAEHRAQTESGA